MPYEVSMSGGAPWGFRIAGGPFAGKPTTISRITPGGKAAQANVMQGDVLIAINGFTVSHLDLTELMETIKLSGWTLHLTLISQEEIAQVTKQKRQSEANITNATETERPRSQAAATPTSLCSDLKSRPDSQQSSHQDESTQTHIDTTSIETTNNTTNSECDSLGNGNTEDQVCNRNEESSSVSLPVTPIQDCPTPKPRRPKSVDFVEETIDKSNITEKLNTTNEKDQEKRKIPDFLRRQLKPPKSIPALKPQVHWLHDKLKITTKRQNGLKDPGNSIKVAAAAYPSRKIEIDGPVSATIIHSQYNTPVGMYSPNQIVSTLVNTAAATGAKVPNPNIFGDKDVTVDQSTAVYKMVHHTDKPRSTPAQSRSIRILDALLEHGQEIPAQNIL